jgi:DNA primase
MDDTLSMQVDPNLIDEVKARNDIVDVVSEYVTLKRAGRNHSGLCPFHSEKTPSFTVSREKQMFYCFGCHESGDVISFVMKRENKGFYEALKTLADRVGMVLPQKELPPAEAAGFRRRQAIYDALSRASSLYSSWLQQERGKHALSYLRGRGLSIETIERFGLGYAPDAWDEMANALRQRGASEEILVAAGLCLPRPGGSGVYDRFRNRVIFPIRDARGRTIGFGARALDDSQPKYINSPETEVFSKGRGLFALNLSRDAARDEGFMAVVEGYMDAIAAHQAGVRNVVASLGTSLTQEQARQLVHISQNVVIAYDSDAAGQAATLRGLDVLRQAGASVRVCEIPEGKDPDDLIRSKGAEVFSQVLKEAPTLVEFFLGLYRAKYGDSRAGRIRTASAMVPVLEGLDDPVELSESVKLVAGRLGLTEEAVRQQATATARRRAAARGHKTAQSRNTKTDADNLEDVASKDTPAEVQAQRRILGLMISSPERRKKALEELGEGLFSSGFAGVFAALGNDQFDKEVDFSRLNIITGDKHKDLIAEVALADQPQAEDEQVRLYKDCALVLKRRRLRRLYAEIQSLEPGAEGCEQLFGEYQGLLQEIKK